jgi:hypothetical protein
VFSPPTANDVAYVIGASVFGVVLMAAAIAQLRSDRATRSSEELRNRRRNYFPLAMVLGIAVFLIPDVVDETVTSHHVDEFIDYTLGAVALAWLFWPGLRFRSVSIWPVIAGLALMSNVLGIVIEYREPDDVGGDILTTTLMVLTIAIHLYRLRRTPAP